MAKAKFPFTPNEGANVLLAEDGTALLIGLCLEQQVPSQKALSGPFVLRERLGHIDARKIAAMRPQSLDKVFREKPALHRFPGMMAKRVQQLCRIIADEYGNRGERVWEKVTKAPELFDRLRALPGFGDEKAACGVRILGSFGGRKTAGWEKYASPESMPWVYKDGKRVDS
ncbi:MAG TPA: HhH-GPD-type base excision DNA repair protein [Candidatus Eremiobacteraceae bacterium]|nr:HhH-GPD-type base excision DNA repair protein [Candidatus Eremiobacteraceae bacterium]